MKRLAALTIVLVFLFSGTVYALQLIYEENFDDSSGFTVGGASAAYWGIAPLAGTASIPSNFTQGGSQEGNIFYGSFAKDYFDNFNDPSLPSLMTINLPDLTYYASLELTVALASVEGVFETTHRDSLHIINGTTGGD